MSTRPACQNQVDWVRHRKALSRRHRWTVTMYVGTATRSSPRIETVIASNRLCQMFWSTPTFSCIHNEHETSCARERLASWDDVAIFWDRPLDSHTARKVCRKDGQSRSVPKERASRSSRKDRGSRKIVIAREEISQALLSLEIARVLDDVVSELRSLAQLQGCQFLRRLSGLSNDTIHGVQSNTS